jgi:hypothetical protein
MCIYQVRTRTVLSFCTALRYVEIIQRTSRHVSKVLTSLTVSHRASKATTLCDEPKVQTGFALKRFALMSAIGNDQRSLIH